MSPGRLLLVDDDEVVRVTTAALLREDGYEVVTAANAHEAVNAIATGAFDLLLADLRMPGLDGIRLIEVLRRRGEGIPILVISGFGTVESTVQALHAGADDFLTKPVDPVVLSERVAEVLARRPPARDASPDDMPPNLVGRSPAMLAVYAAIRLVGPTDATVLVSGETGTGKEVVARAIHQRSPRRAGPFVAVNCAALADGVLESELYGHVRGAFTGAVRDRAGVFEAADGGTIFLDEIGDMSPAMQHRLLRVLQEREITPVGSVRPVPVDVRVVAASNRELRTEVDQGRFREDLYYRLNVFRVELPPLRDREGDVPLLVRHALDADQAVVPLAARMLQAYRWPGNVRELIAALESARIRAAGGPIDGSHLPPEVRAALGGADAPRSKPAVVARRSERDTINAALEAAGGGRARAAEMLGISRTTLWRRLKHHGLDTNAER
jgi:DNA-binding NtrC family response regulator